MIEDDGTVIQHKELGNIWFEHRNTDSKILEFWVDCLGLGMAYTDLTKQDIRNLRNLCQHILENHKFED